MQKNSVSSFAVLIILCLYSLSCFSISYSARLVQSISSDMHIPTISKVGVGFVKFSNDNKHFIIDLDKKNREIWAYDETKWVKEYSISTIADESVSHHSNFSSEGTRVLMYTGINTVVILEFIKSNKTWMKIATLEGPSEATIFSCYFSPDGTNVLVISLLQSTYRVDIWGCANNTWKKQGTIEHDGIITSARFSANGMNIVTASVDKTCKIWERVEGNWQDTKVVINHDGIVYSARFSNDNKHIITASQDGFCKIFKRNNDSTEERNEKWQLRSTIAPGHGLRSLNDEFEPKFTSSATPIGLATMDARFNHNGTRILTSSLSGSDDKRDSVNFDKSVRVWRFDNDEWLEIGLMANSDNRGAAFTHTEKQIITFNNNAKVALIWEENYDNEWVQKHRIYCNSEIKKAVLTSDGNRMMTMADNAVIMSTKDGNKWNDNIIVKVDGIFAASACSPDGTHVVTVTCKAGNRINGVYNKVFTTQVWKIVLNDRSYQCTEE